MTSPHGVAGPGALSARTDVQPMRTPTGMAYGEAGELTELQRSAPLSASPTPPLIPPIEVTGFDAPTTRPGEPVTAGAGPDGLSPLAAAGQPVAASGEISAALLRAAASDPSGELAQLAQLALERGL